MIAFSLLLALVGLFVGANASDSTLRRYDGDQVLSIEVPNTDVWESVLAILNQHIPVQEQDVWGEPKWSTHRGFVMVPSRYISQVTHDLQQANINYKVTISDVQGLITKANAKNDAIRQQLKEAGRRDINGTFPRYDDLVAWMEETALSYPELATTFSIGLTFQNRNTQVLKLGLAGENKWRVWIDAGLHAREWLAPTTAIYVANQLIQGYVSGNPSILEILQFFDFHILPVANPDGYEYCHTTERLWRKNRKPINGNCTGVDLNRNFAFQWGGVGSDADPCSNLYRGPSAESEVEVGNIVGYILPEASKFLLYHAYHTWGELFFTRWDYTSGDRPADHSELFDLASRAVNSINNVHRERYAAGIAPELMYAFAGSSSDWARGVANIKYPFLTELRDFDGTYGFVAPPEEIEPCGQENWAGLQAILVEIMSKWIGTSPPF